MVKLFFSFTPFLRIVIPFLLGMWIYEKHEFPLSIFITATLFLFVLYGLFVYFYRRKPVFKLGFLSGLLMILFMICFGVTYHSLRAPVILDSSKQISFNVQIRRWVGETEKNNKYEVKLLNVPNDSIGYLINKKGIIYISKAKEEEIVRSGNILNVNGRLMPYEPSSMPYQFDYAQYLKYNRIAFRLIVFDFEASSNQKAFLDVGLTLIKFKEFINKRFIEHGMGREELAVLNAMFLGDKHQLSFEQKQAFVGAGAMHLLAVSGLHLGIIYLLFSFVFRTLFKNRKVIFISVLVALWLYALLTGFSASVLRAAIMFSVIEFGRLSQRRIHIINLLSVSMFIILLIDPLFIYSVGFWLSHCAVASIVLFYPYLDNWVHFKFPPFRWLWSVLALSVTAQLGALPISMMTFHQFPAMFILTNWLLIPIVTPVLILGVLGAVFSPFPFILQLIIPALNDLLTYMNQAANAISELPNASLQHIPFTWWQMVLFFMTLITLLIRIEFKTLRSLRLFLLMTILFVGSIHLNHFIIPKEGLIAVETDKGIVVNYFNPIANELYVGDKITVEDANWLLDGLWAKLGVRNKPLVYQHCINPDSFLNIRLIEERAVLVMRGDVGIVPDSVNEKLDYLINMQGGRNPFSGKEDSFSNIMLFGGALNSVGDEKK